MFLFGPNGSGFGELSYSVLEEQPPLFAQLSHVEISMILRDHCHHMEGSDEEIKKKAQNIYDYTTNPNSDQNAETCSSSIIRTPTTESPWTNKEVDRAAETLSKLAAAAPESKQRLKALATAIFKKEDIQKLPPKSQEKLATAFRLLDYTEQQLQDLGFSKNAQDASFNAVLKKPVEALNTLNLNRGLAADFRYIISNGSSFTNIAKAYFRHPAKLAAALASLRALSKGNPSIAYVCDQIERHASPQQKDYIALRKLLPSDKNGEPKSPDTWSYLIGALISIHANRNGDIQPPTNTKVRDHVLNTVLPALKQSSQPEESTLHTLTQTLQGLLSPSSTSSSQTAAATVTSTAIPKAPSGEIPIPQLQADKLDLQQLETLATQISKFPSPQKAKEAWGNFLNVLINDVSTKFTGYARNDALSDDDRNLCEKQLEVIALALDRLSGEPNDVLAQVDYLKSGTQAFMTGLFLDWFKSKLQKHGLNVSRSPQSFARQDPVGYRSTLSNWLSYLSQIITSVNAKSLTGCRFLVVECVRQLSVQGMTDSEIEQKKGLYKMLGLQ